MYRDVKDVLERRYKMCSYIKLAKVISYYDHSLVHKTCVKLRRKIMQRLPKTMNKKRLVRYKEGAEMYSMGLNKFQSLSKEAGAIIKIDRMVLVDLDVFDEYLESFRVK